MFFAQILIYSDSRKEIEIPEVMVTAEIPGAIKVVPNLEPKQT